MPVFLRALRSISAAAVVAAFLGMGTLASAANNNKPSPPAKPAPHPSGGASHATGGGASHGPTAGGAGSHTTTTTETHTTTTTGTHTTTTGGGAGGHTTTGSGTHTTTPSHSAFGGSTPKGSNEHVTKGGNAVRTRPNGRVSDVHDARRGMDVHHGLNGNRRVSVQRHDGSRLVAEHGRRGYVERGYSYHGHDFGRRSYYYHGHEYNRYYRGYGFRGLSLSVYAPGFYFAPGFYGWAYNPWAAPIAFGWGWAGSPWLGFYGGFFAPYPVYPSAAFWLTDYIISQDLQAAYAAHQEAGEVDGAPSSADGPPELSPDVKQMVADEVKNQLALENSEAAQNAQQQDVDPGSSGIARMLADGRPHTFVAGAALDLVDTNGQECAISDGDVLQLQTPPPSDATAADLVVMASEGYPDSYPKGLPIRGLDEVDALLGVKVFHAGTKLEGGRVLTNGGRVLGVTALGDTITQAKLHAYSGVKKIRWPGAWCRKDIADKAILGLRS